MKSFKQIVKETVAEPKSPDEKRFKELHTKNVDVKDYPAKGDEATKDSKKKPRLADYTKDEEELVYDTSYSEEVETLGEETVTCPECGKEYEQDEEHECAANEDVKEEMTDAQMKKREEIVKSMKKKQADFKDKYGDKWKDVMYATATKMAMKEEVEVEELDEAFKAGSMKLKDGSKATLSKDDANAVNELFKELNSSNKKKMEAKMMENKDGFDEIVKFAKEAM